jgi:hypothetical protein
MQAIESETLILYHTDLRGQWPAEAARAFAARLPYARRLALRGESATAQASLAGAALALRALGQLLGRTVSAGELVFAAGSKPVLGAATRAVASGGATTVHAAAVGVGLTPDFSISHSGPWVGCAALARGRIGLDIELGTERRIADWVVREAALKSSGEGLHALEEVRSLHSGERRLLWRGECWHVRRLEQFAGACACVVSSLALHSVEAHAVVLGELFAP